jgi:uncharacterized protein
MSLPRANATPGSLSRSRRQLVAALVTFVFALLAAPGVARAQQAFTPPPLRGHVVDQAGALTEPQVRHLDRKLDRARREVGYAIVVYLLPQLPEGLSIEDVGYQAGNAWGVGSKGGDDGVLLIASLAERKLRIETGKGAGGALTDIGSSHINRDVIGPLMKEGRAYEAMDRGVDAIIKELREGTPGGVNAPGTGPATKRGPPKAQPAGPASLAKFGVIAALVIGVIILAIVSPTFREILFWVLLFGRFGGGGGGGRGRDDDDSGYGGGGGTFGGGGSSDDY